MKKTIFILSIISLFFQNSIAQFSSTTLELQSQYAESIKKHTLVVILLTENEKHLEKLIKKNSPDIEIYKKTVKGYNENIQLLIPKIFNISSDIKYKTFAEIELMTESERKSCNFMLLNYVSELHKGFNDLGNSVSSIDFYSKKGPEYGIRGYNKEAIFDSKVEQYLSWEFYTFNEEKGHGKVVYHKNLPNIFLTKGDIFYSLTQMQLDFENVGIKKKNITNMQLLKEKILLINNDDVVEGNNRNIISENYPYNFELVSKEIFDKVILEKNANYCCLMIIPLGASSGGMVGPSVLGMNNITQIQYAQVITDVSTGLPVNSQLPADDASRFIKGNKKIHAHAFKEFTKGMK